MRWVTRAASSAAPVGHGQFLGLQFWRGFQAPSARSCRTMIAVRANTAQILAEVALALLSFYVSMELGSRSHHSTKRLMSAIPARMMIWSLGFVARLPTLPPDSCSAAVKPCAQLPINVVWRCR